MVGPTKFPLSYPGTYKVRFRKFRRMFLGGKLPQYLKDKPKKKKKGLSKWSAAPTTLCVKENSKQKELARQEKNWKHIIKYRIHVTSIEFKNILYNAAYLSVVQ
jgi:hypothetical protein